MHLVRGVLNQNFHASNVMDQESSRKEEIYKDNNCKVIFIIRCVAKNTEALTTANQEGRSITNFQIFSNLVRFQSSLSPKYLS